DRGVLSWQNKQADGVHTSLIEVPLAGRRPYEIALDLRHLPASQGRGAGLQWAATFDGTTCNRVLVGADGRFAIVRSEAGQEREIAAGPAGFLAPQAPVRLTLRVLGPRTVLFLNGVVVWTGESLPLTGSHTGVVIAGGAAMEFDNLHVRHLRGEDAVFAERLAAYEAARGDAARVFLPPPAAAPVQTHVANAVSAATLAGWEQEGMNLLLAKKFSEAATLFRRILARQPEYPTAHYALAWCVLNLGDAATARTHAEAAVALDPLGLTGRSIAFYAAAGAGDEAAATEHLRHIAFFDGTGSELANFNLDLDILAQHGWRDTLVARWRPRLAAALATRQDGFLSLAAALNRCNAAAQGGSIPDLTAAVRDANAEADRLPAAWQALAPWVAQFTGGLLASLGDARGASPFLERAYTALHRPGASPAPYLAVNNAVQLANASLTMSDAERAYQILEGELPAAQALPAYASRLKGDLLNTLCQAAARLGREAEQRKYAALLLGVTGTGRDAWFQAWAHLHRGGSFASTRLPPEAQEMKAAYERALALATAHGLDDLARSAGDSLALAYWKLGEKDRARDTYLAGAEREEKRKDFAQAEVLLNNLGALYLQDRNHAEAAGAFRRAVALTERARASLGPEERIRFLASRVSAYQFLITALHHTGGAAELFEVENAMRGRSLAETLNLQAPPPAVTLPAFQAGLAPDEAAVFYTVVGAAEIVAHVVTADGARSVWCDGRALVAALKARHLDRFNAKRPGYKPLQTTVAAGGQVFHAGEAARQIRPADFEDVVELYRVLIDAPPDVPRPLRAELLGEFSGALGKHLLDPVAPLLAGKRKLIVFPDGILNFVPFEALPLPGGRHLVEQFDVRYVQSAAVWSSLRQRNYGDTGRRSFLGMGGAQYATITEQAAPVADAARHVQLQIAAQRNVQTGASQREVYAALFGSEPMKYLAGSLIEVRELGKLFADGAIFTGPDMSEPRLKAMARDGSLAQFRIVHLATHGFAVTEVPELSGIAMTLLPTAEGGEDGYLTAPEIARLGMKADLAVLSACQTALGRIYGGEGVAGLTGSLLLGGANRALVSLWPVSDEGTMRFMREMHALVLAEGVSYDVAVNRVKRRFIAGDFGAQFQDLYIWAPFIHYGL
ncbi:MAG TPA: CHAT domain-containing protein, partial [Lacunisphaera sp.]|nr:CHAT domain-containing protein [Lacunisphaera sp.]